MKEFLGKDFLLDSPLAISLFEKHAKGMPIFDFHCHLSPEEICKDHKFRNITEAWLGGDHYKWRLLREMGVEEKYITGDASDKEKFLKYAECMPYFIGNPIYEWTHLELRRFFGIEKTLCPANAEEIWEEANKQLATLTARKMMEKMNVVKLYTTDDPVDDLHYHERMAKDPSLKCEVKPCWRPDKAINLERPEFIGWVRQLEKVCGGRHIATLSDMLECLDQRMKFFVEHGCQASDHSLEVLHFSRESLNIEEANKVFQKGLRGEAISFVRARKTD